MLRVVLLQIDLGTFPPNVMKIGQHLTYQVVIVNRKRVPIFFETQCSSGNLVDQTFYSIAPGLANIPLDKMRQ